MSFADFNFLDDTRHRKVDNTVTNEFEEIVVFFGALDGITDATRKDVRKGGNIPESRSVVRKV